MNATIKVVAILPAITKNESLAWLETHYKSQILNELCHTLLEKKTNQKIVLIYKVKQNNRQKLLDGLVEIYDKEKNRFDDYSISYLEGDIIEIDNAKFHIGSMNVQMRNGTDFS